MQVEIDPRSLKEDLITDSPWRWSGALVVAVFGTTRGTAAG
jgi:hypothetical protein